MDKEGEIMDRVLDRIQKLNIPPHIEQQIGLKKDWKKKVSPEKTNEIITTANKFKTALRKLSKN